MGGPNMPCCTSIHWFIFQIIVIKILENCCHGLPKFCISVFLFWCRCQLECSRDTEPLGDIYMKRLISISWLLWLWEWQSLKCIEQTRWLMLQSWGRLSSSQGNLRLFNKSFQLIGWVSPRLLKIALLVKVNWL